MANLNSSSINGIKVFNRKQSVTNTVKLERKRKREKERESSLEALRISVKFWFSTCTRPLHVFTPQTETISAPVPYNPKQSTPHHLHGSFIRPKLNDTHSIQPRFTLFFVFSLQFPIFCSLCVCCFPDIGLYEDWKYWDVLVGE